MDDIARAIFPNQPLEFHFLSHVGLVDDFLYGPASCQVARLDTVLGHVAEAL